MTPLSLTSYEDWKHCITVLCRIPLTPDYVASRRAALADPTDYGTQRFVQVWGAPHLDRVRGWFDRAGDDMRTGAASPP